MKRCIIFSGGDMDTDRIWKAEYGRDFILCADGGFRHALRLGVTPDMIIGDLDSGIESYPDEIRHRIFPAEKDKTDTNLCLDFAIENGYDDVLLLGGFGGRRDHEYSHYCLMYHALRHGVRMRMVSGTQEIWMENAPFVLYPNEKKYISFFPFGGDVKDFCVHGLKYEAEEMILRCDCVQASSNQFDGGNLAEICFAKGGTVLVMRCTDNPSEG